MRDVPLVELVASCFLLYGDKTLTKNRPEVFYVSLLIFLFLFLFSFLREMEMKFYAKFVDFWKDVFWKIKISGGKKLTKKREYLRG